MPRNFDNGIDLNLTPIQEAILEQLASDPTNVKGRFYYHTGTDTFRFQTGTQNRVLGRLDQISAPEASVGMNSQKLVSLADATNATDATTLQQVQSLVSSIAGQMAWKDSVRVAATTKVSVSSPDTTIDGVTMTGGDRVLLTAQTAGSENGIYVWNGASVAMTRSTDADTAPELISAVVPVEQGSANADTVWILTTDSITIGTTALNFSVLFRNTAQVRKYSETYGGSANQTINHNLGSTDVHVQVRDTATNNVVEPDIIVVDLNNVRLVAAAAPPASGRRVVVIA